MKRIVSLVLALSMVLGLCATSFAAVALEDVAGTKYEAAVNALIELEVVSGYPDETYRPEVEINRAELAKLIVISMGLEEDAERAQADTIFTDEALKDNGKFAWARGYVNTAAAAGVIKGYPTGDFKPEKTVTYAEALTMMLRALGYGNVMEAEGTWPTNALLKAKELELVDDVKYASSSDGANRGDVAILLWNMLRTPMWKIESENQGTGMTSKSSKIMLNVKFPDYMYDDEGVVESFVIEDGEVTLTIGYEDDEDVVGTVTDIDLLRLLKGMKVSYLYNVEDEEFLAVTPVDELVEGRVDEDGKVNDKEYKNMEADEGEYVVLLLDGKKVVTEVVLPEEGTIEAGTDENSLKSVKKDIDEGLVIIDGEWSKAEDLKEGDIVTEVTPEDNEANEGEESFFVVARERVEGEFESFTRDEDAEEERFFFEVDGEEYEAVEDDVTVYEYNSDDEEYEEVEDAFDLFDDKKCKYFGEEVELAIDYLGNVINVYFDEVDKTTSEDYAFYVLTGKYVWSDVTEDGKKFYAKLSNADGNAKFELVQDFESGEFTLPEDGEDTYESLPVGEDEEIDLQKALLDRIFAAVVNDDDALEYDEDDYGEIFSDMYVVDVTEDNEQDDEEEDILDEDNYFVGTFGDDEKEMRPGEDTVVYTIKAIIEENDDEEEEVTGIEVEVSTGIEALEGVEYAKFVVGKDGEEDEMVAKYVFVATDAKSNDLNFGVVERFTDRAGINYVEISGERYEIKAADIDKVAIGDAVSYRVDEDVVSIRDVMHPSDIDDEKAPMVTETKDGIIEFSLDQDALDTGRKTTKDDYKDTLFVLVNVELTGDDENEVSFDSDVKVLGEGLENASFKKGDRVLQGKVDTDLVCIVRGLTVKQAVSEGLLAE